MRNIFGTIFRVTTFGESHGAAIGAVVDGCPPRMALDVVEIQAQLDRRRPGQSRLTTSRQETDTVRILSGVENGLTLGSPIALLVANADQRPGDYTQLREVPRPSHADYTYHEKYGATATSGGGRASARETVGRVAAGAVAEKLLKVRHNIEIVAWVSSVENITCEQPDVSTVSRQAVDASIVRCPDRAAARLMEQAIETAGKEGDSVGGTISCVCRRVPIGLGEPVFGKTEALLAAAMLSIPACKGFEVGSGFEGARLRGSKHNDAFVKKGDHLGTATNRSGGIQGGITNGEDILFRVAFKPTATIRSEQHSVDYDGQPVVLEITKGRHDPCVLPRAVPVVESMAALVLADLALMAETCK